LARVEVESFTEGTEIVRVYLAATLAEAQSVERVLSAAGATFAVEVETFASSTPLGFGSARSAAGFWVEERALGPAADALERAGLLAGLVDRGGGG
jgi:hypothetical protein